MDMFGAIISKNKSLKISSYWMNDELFNLVVIYSNRISDLNNLLCQKSKMATNVEKQKQEIETISETLIQTRNRLDKGKTLTKYRYVLGLLKKYISRMEPGVPEE